MYQISYLPSFFPPSIITFFLTSFRFLPFFSPTISSFYFFFSGYLSFFLAAVCPFSVLPSLRHSALIRRRTGSFFILFSSLQTLLAFYLPTVRSMPSSLSSADKVTCCGHEKARQEGAFYWPTSHQKARVCLSQSQTRTDQESNVPTCSFCLSQTPLCLLIHHPSCTNTFFPQSFCSADSLSLCSAVSLGLRLTSSQQVRYSLI